MTGADLRCGKCGAGAVDVDPTLTLGPSEWPLVDAAWAISWHCMNGHTVIEGIRNPKKGWEQIHPKEGTP